MKKLYLMIIALCGVMCACENNASSETFYSDGESINDSLIGRKNPLLGSWEIVSGDNYFYPGHVVTIDFVDDENVNYSPSLVENSNMICEAPIQGRYRYVLDNDSLLSVVESKNEYDSFFSTFSTHFRIIDETLYVDSFIQTGCPVFLKGLILSKQ